MERVDDTGEAGEPNLVPTDAREIAHQLALRTVLKRASGLSLASVGGAVIALPTSFVVARWLGPNDYGRAQFVLLVYFYAHYAFASITAHATAMYLPFLAVILAAGAPPFAAALLLAYCSNLMAGLTHYGTTPGPIYFGAGYVRQQTWWWLGFVASVPNIVIWATVGFLWWKLLGWW